jgi:hypothetical protein
MSRGIRGAAVLIPARQKKMVPTVGFELTTYRLQGGCSTKKLCELFQYLSKNSFCIPIVTHDIWNLLATQGIAAWPI